MKTQRGERGAGIVELLISLAIAGTILSTLGMTLVAIIKDSAVGRDQQSATHQLRDGFFWLNQDTQSAVVTQSTIAANDALLQWTDYSTGSTYSSRYQQAGTDLERTLTVNGAPTTRVVARNLTVGGFTASLSGASVTYTLTVQNGSGTQSRTETTLMRVSDTPITPFPTVTYTPTPTNTPTPTPGTWFQTGSYVGDGAVGRTISGLAFQPDIVIVRSNGGDDAVIRTSAMPAGDAKDITSGNSLDPNLITSFGANSFVVGDDDLVNRSGRTYYWTAMKAGANVSTGSYAGNGADNRNITGVAFQPSWVMTMGDGEEDYFRPALLAGDASYRMDGSNSNTNRIQATLADGFQVGSHQNVNQSGVTYYWIAFASTAKVVTGTYTGNGADNRNITGLGMNPGFVWVKRSSSSMGVWRTDAVSGDRTLYWDNTSPASNRIQSLFSDGFQVGTNSQANSSGSTYYYLALAP